MKKIFSLAPWKLFVVMILPYIPLGSDWIELTLGTLVSIAGAIYGYSLGIALYRRLPGGHRMNLKKFKFHFFFPVIYAVLLSIIILIAMPGILDGSSDFQYGIPGAVFTIVFVLHLFAMYCIFYCMYFLAKALITVETQNKNIETGNYIGYFFAFWFLPIGIWFIQPKVRELVGR